MAIQAHKSKINQQRYSLTEEAINSTKQLNTEHHKTPQKLTHVISGNPDVYANPILQVLHLTLPLMCKSIVYRSVMITQYLYFLCIFRGQT